MKKINELIFVADPMCSWCWGFEPVLQRILKETADGITCSLLMGGLRSKGDQEWNTSFKDFLKTHWDEVERRTGQSFAKSLLEKEDFDYDTEPASRALVCVRELDESKQFTFFSRLQKAFYAMGKDITQTEVLTDLAVATGFEAEEFLNLFHSERIKENTLTDRYRARSMGANVFPSIVLIDTEGHLCVLKGYKTYEELIRFLQ